MQTGLHHIKKSINTAFYLNATYWDFLLIVGHLVQDNKQYHNTCEGFMHVARVVHSNYPKS